MVSAVAVMAKFASDEMQAAHRHCVNNRRELEASALCGCFYCTETYSPTEVMEWVDRSDTALCPRCGIDAVLGDRTALPVDNPEFLKAMRRQWFEG